MIVLLILSQKCHLTSDSDDENQEDAVVLSTVHASKGLEYKYVFVSDLDTSFSKRGYSGEVLFTEEFGIKYRYR